MAATSKEKIAEHFKLRLAQLECPFTEGVDESWITELIFSPGEPRIRLLQWLFSRFDHRLNDVLDPQFSATGAKMDSRLQRLLFVASSLGLCALDDADLIKGTTSMGKQTSFMRQLLDMALVCQQAEDGDQLAAPGIVGPGTPLKQQVQEDAAYMRMLAAECDTQQLFSCTTQLLPPDISRQLIRNKQRGDQAELPDLARLEAMAEELAREIGRQTDRLQQLQHEFAHTINEDPTNEAKVQTTLRLALTELQQLMTGFSHCYELEVRPWCNKQRPHLTQLGASFQRVHGLLDGFTQLLDSISSIHTHHSALCSQIRSDLERIRYKELRRQGVTAGRRDSQQVQEYVNILEDSLARLESTMNSTQATLCANLTVSTIKSDS